MKVYKDFDKVIKPTRVPKELWKYENEMKWKRNLILINVIKKKENLELSRIIYFGGDNLWKILY